ncbi:hypothetical protein [Clostridium estertheticum]|nr:hypothetical protein [Clostridium estertheticum]
MCEANLLQLPKGLTPCREWKRNGQAMLLRRDKKDGMSYFT